MNNPTVEQLRHFLICDNDWTDEEFQELLDANPELIDGEATLVSRDRWEELAMDLPEPS